MKKLSLPLIVVTVMALWALTGLVRMPKVASEQPDIYGYGQLPVLLDGRIQPIDSTAARALLSAVWADSSLRSSDERSVWMMPRTSAAAFFQRVSLPR